MMTKIFGFEIYEKSRSVKSIHIWSKVMRMHIGLIICHFLLSTVSITESPKNKIMGKAGLYGLYPCRGSPVKQFFFTGCPEKLQKKTPFFKAPYS